MLLPYAAWLGNTPFAQWLGASTSRIAWLLTVHLFGLTILLGSMGGSRDCVFLTERWT